MSKFNQSTKGANKTVNKSGHEAYKMQDHEKLTSMVLTTMFGEPKYYGDNSNELVRLAEKMAVEDPKYLSNLAIYARRVFNLRSVSHALTAVIARHAREYTRETMRGVIIRADDVQEIMAAYYALYKKPFANALKRGIAEAMNGFDTYSIGKYNGGSKQFRFKDILKITHPKPVSGAQSSLFKSVLDDSVETPYTWETELSVNGNTKEVWNGLLKSGRVGYMALLRNLSNIIKCGADVDEALTVIGDPDRIKKSKQLPFRFYSAYKQLKGNGMLTSKIKTVLSKAISLSADNIDTIPGKTLIAVDTSRSMSSKISARSTISCYEIAVLLGVLASRICEDAVVCYFDCNYSYYGEGKGYAIETYSRDENVLTAMSTARRNGGGTDMSIPMKYIESRKDVFDRVIYLSDNECNWGKKTVQKYVCQYRKTHNPDFWVHAIDLQGYGTQQFFGKNFNLITGWSDAVLPFVNMAEAGIGSIIDTIANYA